MPSATKTTKSPPATPKTPTESSKTAKKAPAKKDDPITSFAKKGGAKKDKPTPLPELPPHIKAKADELAEITKEWLADKQGYPILLVNGMPIDPQRLRISRQQNRDLLGWQDENTYVIEVVHGDHGKAAAKDFGENYDLVDVNGIKVRLANNQGNRPFKQGHCESLAQDMLNGNWAGYVMGASCTVNGETIIYDVLGDCESGQHRQIAYEWAWQLWDKVPAEHLWKDRWPTGPVLESLVVQGTSAEAVIKRTLDNVMPRSVSDVFYTSDIFGGLLPAERRELSDMLGRMVDLLWVRTGKSRDANNKKVAQTHSESVQFVDDHGGKAGHLVRCVKHLWECNGGSSKPLQLIDPKTGKPEVDAKGIAVLRRKGKAISEHVGVTAGKCAAIMWLMGASALPYEEADTYFQDPCDKHIPWDDQVDGGVWDLAVKFWASLADDKLEELEPLREALRSLVDINDASNAKELEKVAVIAKAWADYVVGDPVTFTPAVLDDESGNIVEQASGSCWLETTVDPGSGQRIITEDPWPTFRGVDQFKGPPRVKDGAPPTPKELEAQKLAEREAAEEQLKAEAQARIEAARAKANAKAGGVVKTTPGETLTPLQVKARELQARRVAMQQKFEEEQQQAPPRKDDDIPY